MIAVNALCAHFRMIADINLKQLQLTLIVGNQFAVIAFEMRNTSGNQITAQLITLFTEDDGMPSDCAYACCLQTGYAATIPLSSIPHKRNKLPIRSSLLLLSFSNE